MWLLNTVMQAFSLANQYVDSVPHLAQHAQVKVFAWIVSMVFIWMVVLARLVTQIVQVAIMSTLFPE